MGGHEIAEFDGAKATSLIFRIATLGLSVAAAVVMGTTNQSIYDEHGLRYTVLYTDYSAFVYFVAASSISAVCAAVTVYLSIYKKDECNLIKAGVSVVDVIVQGLLFSASGAAFAVCNVATWGHGGDYAPWSSICDKAGSFCSQVNTSAIICVCAAGAISIAVLTKNARASVSISCRSSSNCERSCHH